MMVPIETPLVFAGFHESVLRDFGPLFEQLGITAAQGGAATGSTLKPPNPRRAGRIPSVRATPWQACWWMAT